VVQSNELCFLLLRLNTVHIADEHFADWCELGEVDLSLAVGLGIAHEHGDLERR